MDLKGRIEANDNRGTAEPYLLLLQEKRTYIGHEEYGHHGKIKYVEQYTGDYVTADTKEELEKEILSWFDEDEKPDLKKYNIKRFWEGYYWETTNVFLTDQGYQDHLKLNKHNLKEHRTFGIHAFRNPEMDEVYKLLTNPHHGAGEQDKDEA